jgi:hypothetical protein
MGTSNATIRDHPWKDSIQIVLKETQNENSLGTEQDPVKCSCQYVSIKGTFWSTSSVWLPHAVSQLHYCQLTHSVGTRDDRLTWRGANKCSCCKQDVASAWTSGSWWSCMMAHAHRKDDRAMQTDVVFPENMNRGVSLVYNQCT